MRRILTVLMLAAVSAVAALAADASAGHMAYDKSCKACHGADGTPNAAIAKMLKADMPDLKSAEVQALSNDEIKKIVTDGKGKMRPVKTVEGDALDNVIAFVRTLKK